MKVEERDMKLIDKFSEDFYQLSSREGWTKEDLENMKNLQKLMYYIEVRCAMKDELEDEEDEEEMEYSRSYNDGRSYGSRYYDGGNMYGRGGGYSNGRSGRYGRTGVRRSNGSSYGGGMPYNSRRYYDNEKENSMNDLRQMISMEQDPEKRSMLENIMHSLEK